ncbi:hypothetical protein, partial [Providencia heimbachae]|uniref:hypothetical protein n=1 Tax=Providencia heimbachae TaxID=333962 RepID=UPI0022401C81
FCVAKSSEYTIILIVARRRHRNAIPRLAGCTPERGGKHGELRDNALQKADGNGQCGQRFAALLQGA